MSDDITERLREHATFSLLETRSLVALGSKLNREAADEIERLREESHLLKLERDELVRHEERIHADLGAILGSDTSLVDAAARTVAEVERQAAEIERLQNENRRMRAEKYAVWATYPDC